MNRKLHALSLAIFWLVFSTVALSQNAADDVQARLSLADGKTIYRMGEPIRLVLTFTAKRDGYTLYSKSVKAGASLDEIKLSSEDDGVFYWAARYKRTRYWLNDSFGLTKISTEPSTFEFFLNEFVRFDKSGKYSVSVKTKRIATGSIRGKNHTLISLPTNAVNFEVKEMSEAEEQAEVKKLSALIETKRGLEDEIANSEQLAYLTGDASTGEKVRLFLDSQRCSANCHQNLYFGLFIAKNQTLAVKLLEEVLRDTNREANYQLLNTLVELRVFQENTKYSISADAKQILIQSEKRASEIQQSYLTELIESLPKRAGKNLTSAAIAFLQSFPGNKPMPAAVSGKLREILLKNFDALNIFERGQLLESNWEQLRDASLAPSLERILTDNNLPNANLVRPTALKRLIELDQTRARPYVIAEIRNPNSHAGVDVLGALDDKFLPETDDVLLEQIRNLAQSSEIAYVQIKALLAARYATSKIYKELLEIYKTNESGWREETNGALLGYFARHNDSEATALIEKRLAKSDDKSGSSVFYNVTKVNFTKGMEMLLRKRLESDDTRVAATAAFYLSRFGDKENLEFVEKRYNRWLKEWNGRGAELDVAENNPPISLQSMFQINLLNALVGGKAWKLPEAEIIKLKQSCITEGCRQQFRVQ